MSRQYDGKNNPTNVRDCPSCGELMIRSVTGETILTDPPKHGWMWWCACGQTERGGYDQREKTDMQRWEEANNR